VFLALNLRPPPLHFTPELAWVLEAAFGPSLAPHVTGGSPALRRKIAFELELAARIATRLGPQELVLALGVDESKNFVRQQLAVTARNRVLSSTIDLVVGLAREHAIPIALVKHAALLVTGRLTEGQRDARDVDVLVPPQRATELERALQARGFERLANRPQPHHLPGMRGPRNEVVEIHHALLGVQASVDAKSASFDELRESGALQSVHGFFVPCPELLAAHAIVHGLVQHASSPLDYLPSRVLADLVDLGGARGWDVACLHHYIRASTPREVAVAACELGTLLARGNAEHALLGRSEEARLLAHLVAASCDQDYREALKLTSVGVVGASARLRGLLRTAFLPTPNDLARGSLSRAPGSMRARLTQPFSAAGSLAKAIRAYLRLRQRTSRHG